MVLLDTQKAFDSVDHKILCNKLSAMRVKSTAWFESYLFDRKQIVQIDRVESDPLTITCGVPQGSILGPLLFLCYVNDMFTSINCTMLQYADDSALIYSDKDPERISPRESVMFFVIIWRAAINGLLKIISLYTRAKLN